MNGKIGRCFLIAFLLFIRPSSGFFKDKCNIDIDLPKLLEGKINAKDVILAAVGLLTVFQENPSFEEKAPSTYKLVVNLVRTKVVTATNLAYAGTAICGAAVLLTTYCFSIHSKKLLAEAQSIDIKFKTTFEAEVLPILQLIEDLFNGDTKDVCDAEIKLNKMLNDRILKIQTIRTEINEKRQEAIEGELQIKFLVLGILAIVSAFVAIRLGVPAGAALFAVIFILGTVRIEALGLERYTVLGEFIKSYQNVCELLYQAEIKAIEAEKILTLSHTKTETKCVGWA